MDPCLPLYILAGGQSRRFGTDKARATLENEVLITRVALALGPVAARVRVVGRRRGQYDDLGLTTVADRTPGLGPLGGVEAALTDRREHAGRGWLTLASCDWLSPDPTWITALWEARGQAGAVVFVDPEGIWQPLPGLIHTDLLPGVREAVRSSERSLWRFLQAAGAQTAPLPGGVARVEQANTPAQLEAYRNGRRL